MDRKKLEFTIRELPGAIPLLTAFRHYDDILRALWACHIVWPKLVAEPRPLIRSKAGRWIHVVTIGNGPLHTIVEVMPHGGELFWLQGCLEYAMFLCEHPWLLEGRTVHLLLSGPDEAALNFEGWASEYRVPDRGAVYGSIRQHFRHPHVSGSHCWAYPLPEEDIEPGVDTLAGMMLVDELAAEHEKNPEVELVLWVSGHNEHVAWGTTFWVDGPGDARSAREAERVARRLRVPLNPGQAEETCVRRHVGTTASWTWPTAAAILAQNPLAGIGNAGFEYARRFFPRVCAQSTEVAMLLPRDRQVWDKMTVRKARWLADRATRYLADDLEPLVELSYLLPETDPFVSATRALPKRLPITGRVRDNLTDGQKLRRWEAFYLSCAGPLYKARACSVASAMVYRNLALARQVWTRQDPLILAGMLNHAISMVPYEWWLDLKQQSIREATALQIISAEIAFYGTLGIHPRSQVR